MKPYYQDSAVMIYHGDCREIMPTIGKFDLVFTDPPYSSGGMVRGDRCGPSVKNKYQNSGTAKYYPEFTGDTMDQRSWTAWMTTIVEMMRGAMVPGALIGCFIDWRQLPSLTDAMQAGGLIWRGIAVWDKTEACRPVLGRPRSQAEFLVWGTNGPHSPAGPCVPGVFRQSVFVEEKQHITEKPTAVAKWFCTLCPDGGVILDPFAGSGTTGRAAKNLGRKAVLIEREEAYCEIAAKRLAQEQLF